MSPDGEILAFPDGEGARRADRVDYLSRRLVVWFCSINRLCAKFACSPIPYPHTKKGAVTKCVIILPQPFFYWNIPLEDYPTCVFIGSV